MEIIPDHEFNKRVYAIIDKFLMDLKYNNEVTYSNLGKGPESIDAVRLMYKYGLIEHLSNNPNSGVCISGLGVKVLNMNGFENYLQPFLTREKQEDDKLRYDAHNAKRIYKTYWITARYSDKSTPVFRDKVPHLFRSKVRQPDRPVSSLSKSDIFQT